MSQRSAAFVLTLLAAVGASPTAWPGSYVPPPAYHVRQLQIPANDIAYDPFSRSIYAVVPGSAGVVLGNRVVQVDPFAGTVVGAYFVGSEPSTLALSGGGEYAYVGLAGSNSVRRFSLSSKAVDLTIPLGSASFFGPLFAQDIAAMPGTPESFAVSLRYSGVSPSHAGVAVYDGAARRPLVTPGHTGSNRIEFSGEASILYGYNNESTEYGFRTLQVEPSGVMQTSVYEGLISGFSSDIEFDAGRIYGTDGRVIDPALGFIDGTYPLCPAQPCFGGRVAVEPSAGLGATFFAQTDFWGSGAKLSVFDQATFVALRNYDVPEVTGQVRTLIEWGDGGLAMLTDTGSLVLLTPVPEPGTWAMLSAGLICLLTIARRRLA